MKLLFTSLIQGALLGWALIPVSAQACGPEQDGCLGCNDEELPVCLQVLIENVCQSSGNPVKCDTARVYDDAERYILTSTGSHMSRIRAMFRSSRKYQMH